MSTSAWRMSSSAISWPRSTRRLSVMHRLLRTSTGHSRPLPSTRPRPHSRIESGLPGGSTLMTSAPRSPSSRPANGPASMPPSSMTRTPASGPAFLPTPTSLPPRALHELLDARELHARAPGRGAELLLVGVDALPALVVDELGAALVQQRLEGL